MMTPRVSSTRLMISPTSVYFRKTVADLAIVKSVQMIGRYGGDACVKNLFRLPPVGLYTNRHMVVDLPRCIQQEIMHVECMFSMRPYRAVYTDMQLENNAERKRTPAVAWKCWTWIQVLWPSTYGN